ncbi:kisspeptin 2 [Clupea harengus]|uniref:Kisspeptin 2 n=1 Tax=Clupea harengus TaxID=7950 RepID=A0A8M1KPV7_CLUHA|nr:kisspeptin 2 [Clupea harengus]
MRMHALLLISAIICQYGATGTLMYDYEQPELTSTQGKCTFPFIREIHYASVLIEKKGDKMCQQGNFFDYMNEYNFISAEPAPVKVRRYAEVARRETDSPGAPEDEALCLLSKERDAVMHLSCKQRLTRSKFNINPFGLRFGKRQDLLNTPAAKSGTRKLLPILLYLRDLQIAT